LREDWITVNVGKQPGEEEENVVLGDTEEAAEIVSTEASFKGGLV
jgi:hypothetical protein